MYCPEKDDHGPLVSDPIFILCVRCVYSFANPAGRQVCGKIYLRLLTHFRVIPMIIKFAPNHL